MLKRISLVTMSAAVALSMAAGSANAQPQGAVYGGGSTLASKVYRQLFDCWAIPANSSVQGGSLTQLPISSFCPSPTGKFAAPSFQILYAPVGSGKGKQAFVNHDGSNSTTTGLGTPATSNTIPYTSSLLPNYGYQGFHFAGSDDVITQSDINTYNANNGPTKYGAILQIPSLVTPVSIPFNGKDGNGNPLNINPANVAPTGASSKLNLSRQAYCGIFSGHITQWDNPILTALNGGTVLGHGNITVVHRQDGSGTTFLLTNALVAQCGYSLLNGPNTESDPTIVSYAFPFPESTSGTIKGGNLIKWPDAGGPASAGHFINASGTGGVVNLVGSTNGAIGYSSPDFVQPVQATAPATANLQNYNDIVNSTGQFQAPTPLNANTAMTAANYNMTLASMTNPLTWSTQGVQPEPTLAGAYPISGFTWLDLYQCYEPTNGAEIGLLNFLTWYYNSSIGGTEAFNILVSNGFAPIPYPWFSDAAVLAVVSNSAFGYPGNGKCTGVSAPGA